MTIDYFNDIEFLMHAYTQKSIFKADRTLFNGYYGLQFITRGKIFAQFGDGPLESGEGPLVFITYPGVPMSYGNISEENRRDHIYITFKGPRVQDFIKGGLLECRREHYFMPIFNSSDLLALFQQLFSQLASPQSIMSHMKAVHLLEQMLVLVATQCTSGALRYRTQLERLLFRIQEDLARPWDFNKISDELQISYLHFRRLFLNFTGLPVHQYLQQCRIRRAQQLLLSTHLRINEIAEMCGFSDAYHFYRCFNKTIGESPLQYRKRYGV